MSTITFKPTDYNATSGIVYTDLSPNVLAFASTGLNLAIRVSGYSDILNVCPRGSIKRIRSSTNIKRTDFDVGTVSNDIIKFQSLPLKQVPNWASSVSIRFGGPSSTGSFDITDAKLAASGGVLKGLFEAQATGRIEINAFEICHTSTSTGIAGSGSNNWVAFKHQSKDYLSLVRNPGPSGLYAAVGSTGVPSNQHDWHVGLCIRPLEINVNPFMGLACIIEYI